MAYKTARHASMVLAALLLGACAKGPVASEQPPENPPPGSGTGLTGNQQSDWAAIERLEVQAKAIAKTSGCQASSECRTAPVGNRACGGPRYYIPYCAKTTDSVALFAKLAEVAKAEDEYNRKYQIASTCEFRMPPDVVVAGGSCATK